MEIKREEIFKQDIEYWFNHIIQNKWKINREEFKDLNKIQKIILLTIKNFSKRFNVIIDKECKIYELRKTIQDNGNFQDIWISKYIEDILWYNEKKINPITKLESFTKLSEDLDKANNPLLFLLKIENFKNINTVYGFDYWTELLKKINQNLKVIFKKLNINIYNIWNPTHIGLFIDLDSEGNKSLKKEDIIEEVSNILNNFKIEDNGVSFYINFSCSCVNSKENIYNKALNALYSPKQNNDSLIVEYTKKQEDENILEGLKFNNRLKLIIDAIEKDRIVPFYQWIRNNETKKIEKYEALVRLKDPFWQILNPIEFLDVAEKTWYIKQISEIIVKKVIEEMVDHNFNISINFTKWDILNKNHILYVIDLLKQNNINPQRLTVEILEDVFLEDYESKQLNKNIKLLKNEWIKISIDDFWTGYSNLERLLLTDIDFIKVDQSLIKNIVWNKKNIELLKIIKQLGILLDAKIIAEYVENKEIQQIIEILNIDFSQGYYYSKPEEKWYKK